MAKVKITGHASGTGVLTVTAPNTSSDRTITLPDSTGTLLDENSSLPAANLTGTVADARISTLTASKLTGALPAISGASLTSLPAASAVAFPATQVASADANTLDDYEEGTWTPILIPASGSTQTYTINSGLYTKIGRLVTYVFAFTINSLGDASGGAKIGGFPFTNLNNSANYGSISIGLTNSLNLGTAGYTYGGFHHLNTTNIELNVWDSAGGMTLMQCSELSDGALIRASGHFFTA